MSQLQLLDPHKTMVRPVRCYFCAERMHYAGQPEHEPEVSVEVSFSGALNERFYAHARCWNARMFLTPNAQAQPRPAEGGDSAGAPG